MAFFNNNRAKRVIFLQAAILRRNYASKRMKIKQDPETLQNQDLPSPPVPDLNRSLERYLNGLRPVISGSQYEKTRQLVEQFRVNPGPQLQAELIQFAENVDNWATYFWLDDMYLKNPSPLPIYSNAFILLQKQNFYSVSDQLRFAAKIILFTLGYKKMIDRKSLGPDVIKTRNGMEIPLCMKTYYSFFPAYRRPGELKDELIMSENQEPSDSWHIIVACKNQFFKVQVKGFNSNELPTEDILIEQLRIVTHMAEDEENIQPPVGILTTENRKIWARIRRKMIKSAVNVQSLKDIEDCLFVLCLDECSPNVANCSTNKKGYTTADLTTISHMNYMLHGSGTGFGTANRWNDKFMQFVVTKDGVAGLVGEHSASDGVTVVHYVERLLNSLTMENHHYGSHKHSYQLHPFTLPIPLKWDIDSEISQALQEASKKINRLVRDVDLAVVRFTRYGKDFLRSLKISPDAYMQMVLQLTQYKAHGKLVSTYESASLRRFQNGRVDAIRSVTQEVLKWVKVMCEEPQVSEEIKMELLRSCLKKQKEIMTYTSNGEGPDNHLLALREISKVKDYPDIPLFKDKSYWEYLNFRLSTSQIILSKDEYNLLSGYGPVVPDGYGCCYFLHSNRIDICVSSFYSSKETSSYLFANCLKESLMQVEGLCQKYS